MSGDEMLEQRDQALACMILSLVAAVAVFASVFGKRNSNEIAAAKTTLAAEEKILLDTNSVLETNKRELALTRKALEALQRSRRGPNGA